MSCTVPKLLTLYTDKVNIYSSDKFIIMPTWRSCPAPSMTIIAPTYTTYGPNGEICVQPIPQVTNPPGVFCNGCINPSRC